MPPRFTAFSADPITVARRLLGQRLVRVINGQRLAGTIVEVEAYLGADDAAAHTYRGRRTARNAAMYLPGGHAYIYFTYGMHHCLNIVCGKADEGVAVLLRAIQPTEGFKRMYRNRPSAKRESDLCSGPAKLTQALAIDRSLNEIDMRASGSLFMERLRSRALPPSRILCTRRVGVGYAQEWADRPLRFLIKDTLWASRGR
ncbi:MAG: DNA-3-methyladenine glycosylase [Phycisphaerales bacterium]